MPPLSRAQRTRADRRDEVRLSLLAALEEMLDEGTGFAAIKVEELASRAGISRAGFYIHFQDKVDLLEQWLLETRISLLEACNGWYEADPSLSRDELRAAIARIVKAYRERLTLMLAMHETALYDVTLRNDFAEAFELHFAALTAHIERGQAAGRIDSELLPRETAEWLVCTLERAPTWISREASARELALQVDAATDLIWSTLYAKVGSHL